MSSNDIRRTDTDRRSRSGQVGLKNGYRGPERRSGKDRREWIDRMQETRLKIWSEKP